MRQINRIKCAASVSTKQMKIVDVWAMGMNAAKQEKFHPANPTPILESTFCSRSCNI